MENGTFVISLDFEIYWGVRDVLKISQYKNQLLGVRKAIPDMLELFSKYNINATFATVGFLFFNNKKELLAGLPGKVPVYSDPGLSPYKDNFVEVGDNEEADPFHFGFSLIEKIQQFGQEVASHTFSHYYCLEEGQNIEDFREDIKAAKNIAAKKEIVLKSIAFPRNQYNEAYLKICREEGFTSFRGNENAWIYKPHKHEKETFIRRIFRFIDSYINLTGHHCYTTEYMKSSNPVNIPSSRFLKPYSKIFAFLDRIRLQRIKKSMSYAAENKLCYHLWWHPHNFGINLHENLAFLEKILQHYKKLSKQYQFSSVSMGQLAELLNKENE